VPDGAKGEIRERVLKTRRSTPVEVRAAADAALLLTLLSLVRSSRARTVAAYVPMAGEPGGSTLPEKLIAAGVEVLLPVLRPDLDLDWAAYSDLLVRGTRGTSEPGGSRLGVDAIDQADLVVVPAVAVDASGLRLGRGGGSYDRALAHVSGSRPVVALLYDGELVERLPAEPHDRHVSAVITPSDGFVTLPTSAGRAAGF
jgi:5-formyltetrahydrofolate cyclo-ligase